MPDQVFQPRSYYWSYLWSSKPPKQILLIPYTIKTLTNNVALTQIINQCGNGLSYTQLEKIDTAFCLQKMARASDATVRLPSQIQAFVSTTLAWDNIDRLEETLSGKGTSQRVNGIAIHPRVFKLQLPPKAEPVVVKEKKRSVALTRTALPVYNARDHVGPPSRG